MLLLSGPKYGLQGHCEFPKPTPINQDPSPLHQLVNFESFSHTANQTKKP